MAAMETKIALLSGDLSMLQAALENAFVSDEMRGAILRSIERTLEVLHIKTIEEKEYKEKAREKEIVEKKVQLNEYIRRYAELQVKQEAETRKIGVNRQFYAIVMNMSYALNGVPRWPISVMSPPPEKRLDEKAFITTLRQQDIRYKNLTLMPNANWRLFLIVKVTNGFVLHGDNFRFIIALAQESKNISQTL